MLRALPAGCVEQQLMLGYTYFSAGKCCNTEVIETTVLCFHFWQWQFCLSDKADSPF